MGVKQRGFTLIELLVVISIIGLLASVTLVALNKARSKARDTKRIADLQGLKKAMELYYNDNNRYPIFGTVGLGYGLSNLTAQLVPTYTLKIPLDPLYGDYSWGWGPTDQDWSIYVPLENSSTCKYETANTFNSWWAANTSTKCNFQ